MATFFCTGVSAICLLMIGIIADMEPKTAKQKANAPVPRVLKLRRRMLHEGLRKRTTDPEYAHYTTIM